MTHEAFESLAALDALGVALPEEESVLRSHTASCGACRAARAEMGETASLLALQIEPVAPPPETRDRVLGVVEEPNVVRPFFNHWWWSAAAMFFLALWGWRELGIRADREAMRSQRAEITRLATQNDLLSAKNEKLSAEIISLASADTHTIALSGQQMSPSASAKVFLEPVRRRAVVFFQNMPVNGKDKSYQLWILRADQPKPQSAGTFDITASGRASITIENLPLATEIKGLAVTLEPRGGVEQPTNLKFYVAGST